MTPRPAARAFTLIELVIVMAISGILFLALGTFTRTSLMTTAVVQQKNAAEQVVRTALARIEREGSLARIASATEEYRFAFTTTDLTGDGADDTVAYSWDSTARTLTRTLNGTAETFAANVDLFWFEYSSETEDQTTIVAPGSLLPMALGCFSGFTGGGSGVSVEDTEIDVWYGTWYVEQTFNNLVEVPTASSVTVRARTKTLPPPVDMYITLDNLSQTVAYGWLRRSQLTTTFQDITVPLTWIAPAGVKMLPDKKYRLQFRPGGSYPYADNAGTLLYQKITGGPGLGGGLTLAYWDEFGMHHSLGNTASLYFTVRGDLPATTPTRSTVPASVLKSVKAAMTVTEGAEQASMSRTFKVVNQ